MHDDEDVQHSFLPATDWTPERDQQSVTLEEQVALLRLELDKHFKFLEAIQEFNANQVTIAKDQANRNEKQADLNQHASQCQLDLLTHVFALEKRLSRLERSLCVRPLWFGVRRGKRRRIRRPS